jgi:Alpha amylase, catalytic domain
MVVRRPSVPGLSAFIRGPNGDGIGDLAGLRGRLDHLHWLGVDGIWLNPTFPSPNRDWGYDVSDYFDFHQDLGRLEDLDALIAAAGDPARPRSGSHERPASVVRRVTLVEGILSPSVVHLG